MSKDTYVYSLARWMGRSMALLLGALACIWLWSGPWYLTLAVGSVLIALCLATVVFVISMIVTDEEPT